MDRLAWTASSRWEHKMRTCWHTGKWCHRLWCNRCGHLEWNHEKCLFFLVHCEGLYIVVHMRMCSYWVHVPVFIEKNIIICVTIDIAMQIRELVVYRSMCTCLELILYRFLTLWACNLNSICLKRERKKTRDGDGEWKNKKWRILRKEHSRHHVIRNIT